MQAFKSKKFHILSFSREDLTANEFKELRLKSGGEDNPEKKEGKKDKKSEEFLVKLKSLGPEEVMLLRTCNREEVIYYSNRDMSKEILQEYKSRDVSDELLEKSKTYKDKTALQYIYEVGIGWHSVMTGEHLIGDQLCIAVPRAYEAKTMGQGNIGHAIKFFKTDILQDSEIRKFRSNSISETFYINKEITENVSNKTEEANDHKVLIVGTGKLAIGLLNRLKTNSHYKNNPANITVTGKDQQRLDELNKKYGVNTFVRESDKLPENAMEPYRYIVVVTKGDLKITSTELQASRQNKPQTIYDMNETQIAEPTPGKNIVSLEMLQSKIRKIVVERKEEFKNIENVIGDKINKLLKAAPKIHNKFVNHVGQIKPKDGNGCEIVGKINQYMESGKPDKKTRNLEKSTAEKPGFVLKALDRKNTLPATEPSAIKPKKLGGCSMLQMILDQNNGLEGAELLKKLQEGAPRRQ